VILLYVSARTSIKGDTDVPDMTTCRQDQTVEETSLQGLVVVVVVEMADPLSIAPVMRMVGRLWRLEIRLNVREWER
jgi:hypothetical protein